MNENCPCETTNLTNPSRLFQEKSGLCFTHPGKAVVEFTYYDQLPDSIKLTRQAGTQRMKAQGLTPIDSYTFEEHTAPQDRDHTPQTHTPIAAPTPPPALTRPPQTSGVVHANVGQKLTFDEFFDEFFFCPASYL